MMKDVYVFLFTRITCFSEEEKLLTADEEATHLSQIGQEISAISNYLYINPRGMGDSFERMQSKILVLMDKAKSGSVYRNPSVQSHLNDTDDVLLGCICIVLSSPDQTDFSIPDEDCSNLHVDILIEDLENLYTINHQGEMIDHEDAEDLFLSLQQAQQCGYITDQHRQLINNMIIS